MCGLEGELQDCFIHGSRIHGRVAGEVVATLPPSCERRIRVRAPELVSFGFTLLHNVVTLHLACS